jgi:hypothetical protein
MLMWPKGRRVHPVVVDSDDGGNQLCLGAKAVTVEMAAEVGAIKLGDNDRHDGSLWH